MSKNWLQNYMQAGGKISTEGYKKGSPDKNEPFLQIPSNRITMKGVPHPVIGTDNFGFTKYMLPGNEYYFPGHTVYETPLKDSVKDIPRTTQYKKGGSVPGSNLWDTDRTAWTDSVLSANAKKDWVQQLYNPAANSLEINGKPTQQFLEYGEGDNRQWVYPTIDRVKGVPTYFGNNAGYHAQQEGLAIPVQTPEQAEYFIQNASNLNRVLPPNIAKQRFPQKQYKKGGKVDTRSKEQQVQDNIDYLNTIPMDPRSIESRRYHPESTLYNPLGMTGQEKFLHDQKTKYRRREEGYSDEGELSPSQKLMRNRHYQGFAENIVEPTVELADAVGYGALAKMGVKKLAKSLAKKPRVLGESNVAPHDPYSSIEVFPNGPVNPSGNFPASYIRRNPTGNTGSPTQTIIPELNKEQKILQSFGLDPNRTRIPDAISKTDGYGLTFEDYRTVTDESGSKFKVPFANPDKVKYIASNEKASEQLKGINDRVKNRFNVITGDRDRLRSEQANAFVNDKPFTPTYYIDDYTGKKVELTPRDENNVFSGLLSATGNKDAAISKYNDIINRSDEGILNTILKPVKVKDYSRGERMLGFDNEGMLKDFGITERRLPSFEHGPFGKFDQPDRVLTYKDKTPIGQDFKVEGNDYQYYINKNKTKSGKFRQIPTYKRNGIPIKKEQYEEGVNQYMKSKDENLYLKPLNTPNLLDDEFFIRKNSIEEINDIKYSTPEQIQNAQKGVDEGNAWIKEWYTHPRIQKRLKRNSEYGMDQNVFYADPLLNTQNLPGAVDKFGNVTLADELEREMLRRQGSNVGGTATLHDNQAIIYSDVKNPKSTTIHEGTHQLTEGDFGISNKYKRFLKNIGDKDKNLEAYEKGLQESEILANKGEDPFQLNRVSKGDIKYMTKPTEIHARLNQIRSHYGFTPDDVISEKKAAQIIKDIKNKKTPIASKFASIIENSSDNPAYNFSNVLNKMFGTGVIGAGAYESSKEFGGSVNNSWLQKYK